MTSEAVPPGARIFATTRWSVVLAAGADSTRAGAALGELWPAREDA